MCRQCLCTLVSIFCVPPLHLSSYRSSMFSHAGFLRCFLAFLHTEKGHSCGHKRLSLKISQLSHATFLSEIVSHGMLLSRSLRRLKLAFLKSRIVILSVLPTSLKVHSLRVIADHFLRRLWFEIPIIRLTVAKSYSETDTVKVLEIIKISLLEKYFLQKYRELLFKILFIYLYMFLWLMTWLFPPTFFFQHTVEMISVSWF